MANHYHHTDETADCGLRRFERNRFFNGKLMTARDMAAEQRYHRNRVRMLAEHVTGEGIVSGLETTVEVDGDSLVVRVEPGLAFDACGRPIVVETPATEEIELAALSDPTSLYIDYADCVKESVPVPGSENACEEECTYNRILEIFEISHRSAEPNLKPVREIDFPESTDFDDPVDIEEEDDTLRRIATSYHEDDEAEVNPEEVDHDHGVYLGRFGEDADGQWSRITDAEERAHVYTNDMLYAAVSRHAADFGNPHEVTAEQAGALVSVEGASNPGGNVDLHSPDDSITVVGPAGREDSSSNGARVDLSVSEAIQDQLADLLDRVSDLEELPGRIDEIEEQLEGITRQLMHSTLRHKRLVFALVAERFDSDAANEVSELTSDAIEEAVYEEPDAYLGFAEETLEPERAVADELDEIGIERGLEQYLQAIEELEEALGGNGLEEWELVQRVTHAQGLVAESVEWIESVAREPREDPQFTSSLVTVDQGDTAAIGMTFGDTESVGVQIGDEAEHGYELRAEIRPGGVNRAALNFDTAVAGSGESPVTIEALQGEEGLEFEITNETSQDAPLEPAPYPLSLRVPDTGGEEVDAAELVVEAAVDDRAPFEDSLVQKIQTFEILADRFDLRSAVEVSEFAAEALDSGAHQSDEEYQAAIEETLQLERQFGADLVNQRAVTEESLRAFGIAFNDLQSALREGADARTVMNRQNELTQAAGRLRPAQEEPSVIIDPRELTVDGLEREIGTIQSQEDLELVLAMELLEENRTTAIDQIRGRLREIQ